MLGSAVLWAGRGRGDVLLSYLGGIILAGSLVSCKLAFARARSENWLLRLDSQGVFIQFRSYLNTRLPPADPTVTFLPYAAIRRVRRVTERKEVASRDLENRRTPGRWIQTTRWVEFEVRSSTAALSEALASELAKRPAAGLLYKDYPVRVVADGVIQVRWTVRPGIDTLIAALRPRVAIEAAALRPADFTSLARLPEQEQHRRILELARSGEVVTAVSVARELVGGNLADAKALVDRLVAGQKAPVSSFSQPEGGSDEPKERPEAGRDRPSGVD